MIPDTRLYHLTRARARLFSAEDTGRIGWVRAMELRDAAESLRMAGEPDMAVLADEAATSISADAGVPALLDRVAMMLREERAKCGAAATGWRPIETAPENIPVLVYCTHCAGAQIAVCWQEGSAWHGGPAEVPQFTPMHWMPLPEPPK